MHKEYSLVFWTHLLLLLPAYLSPFLFDWWIVLIGIILLQIQYAVAGGCVITHWEMGKKGNSSFIYHYLKKIFPGITLQATKNYVQFVIPPVIFLLLLILQVGLEIKPLFHLNF